MALTFPPNPTVGDEYQGGTGSWLWNTKNVWERGAGPAPMLTALVPPTGQINAPIDVTIQGANFTPVSIVRHDNINATGVYVSATEMTTVMPSNPTAGTVVQVHVRDNLQISNSLPFTYEAVPLTLTSLLPDTAFFGHDFDTVVQVYGTGFLPDSKVYVDNVVVPSTYISGARLTITMNGAAEPAVRDAIVKVENSNTLPFHFTGATNAPSFQSIDPVECWNTATNQVIACIGNGFHPAAKAIWDGVEQANTVYVTPNRIEFTINATALPTGIHQVGVTNGPSFAAPNTHPFTINW